MIFVIHVVSYDVHPYWGIIVGETEDEVEECIREIFPDYRTIQISHVSHPFQTTKTKCLFDAIPPEKEV